MHSNKALLLAGVLAGLSIAMGSAAAQPASVTAAGQTFLDALAKNAVECKSQLSGISIEAVKAVAQCLAKAVKASAKEALIGLAKGLFDDFLGLVKTNLPKAKETLQSLADKLASISSTVGSMATAVVDAIGNRADAFVGSAGECKEKITALNKASVEGLFTCLKDKAIAAAKGQ